MLNVKMLGHKCLYCVKNKLCCHLFFAPEAFFDEIPDDFALNWVKLSDNKLCSDQLTSSDQVDPTADLNHALPLEFMAKQRSRFFKYVFDQFWLQTFHHRTHHREDFIHFLTLNQSFNHLDRCHVMSVGAGHIGK